jgi:hypothetical protein
VQEKLFCPQSVVELGRGGEAAHSAAAVVG